MMRLIFVELRAETVDKVIKLLRKLPWRGEEAASVAARFRKCVLKVTRHRKIGLVADMLAGVKAWQEPAVMSCVDGALEALQRGMEENDHRQQQKLVSCARLLGQCYNFAVVSSGLIFSTLEHFLNFGHEVSSLPPATREQLRTPVMSPGPDGSSTGGVARLGGVPVHDPRVPCATDGPSGLFRVRLVTELLATCGHYFNEGSTRAKLDEFLCFFQRYMFTKVRCLLARDDPCFSFSTSTSTSTSTYSLVCSLAPPLLLVRGEARAAARHGVRGARRARDAAPEAGAVRVLGGRPRGVLRAGASRPREGGAGGGEPQGAAGAPRGGGGAPHGGGEEEGGGES